MEEKDLTLILQRNIRQLMPIFCYFLPKAICEKLFFVAFFSQNVDRNGNIAL